MVGDAGWTETLLWQRQSAFYCVQFLSAAAAAEDSARTGRFRERIGKSARGDGVSATRICGNAGACTSLDERAEAGNAVDGAAEVEAACGAETAKARKAAARGADAIAVCGDGRTAVGVLAGAVLRFQRVQKGEEDGETEHLHAWTQSGQHARESGGLRIGGTFGGLEVE